MDPIQSRMKTLVLNINLAPDENDDEIDKELDEEGKAPHLKSVDKKTNLETNDDSMLVEANKFGGMLVNGEDRQLDAKMQRGEKPRGLGERVQMEAMKKRVTG